MQIMRLKASDIVRLILETAALVVHPVDIVPDAVNTQHIY